MSGTPEPYLGSVLGVPSRREFIKAGSAIGAALLLPATAFAQKSEIHDLRGSVKVNGEVVNRRTQIKPGDHVVTGSDGYIVFIIGDDAFMLRSRSELRIQPRADEPGLAGILMLITGALGAAFKRNRAERRIKVGTITAGIRGTGVYMETRGDGTYFCTCWGQVDLQSDDNPKDRESIDARTHTPRLISFKANGKSRFKPGLFETHTDAEMDMLEKCVGRRSPLVKPEWFDKQ